MNGVSLEKNVKIRYSELDCNLTLKTSSLLQFLQDLASENAEELGFGYSYIIQHNLAWFLLKLHIEFDMYPKGLYSLDIKTEPRGYNKLFAFRDFQIKHCGEIIGRAVSTWGLVDIEARSMTNMVDMFTGHSQMKPLEKRETDLKYNKISPITNVSREKIFEVRFDDLDVNQHVNNANYITWAFETLDFDFRTQMSLRTLDMVFKKEAKYGEKILVQVEINENQTIHLIKNAVTNEELCLVSALWIKEKMSLL